MNFTYKNVGEAGNHWGYVKQVTVNWGDGTSDSLPIAFTYQGQGSGSIQKSTPYTAADTYTASISVQVDNTQCGGHTYTNVTSASIVVVTPTPTPTLAAASNLSGECSNPFGPIDLSWQDAANEGGYKLARKRGAEAWNYSYAKLPANTTSYSDTVGVTPAVTYKYNVASCRPDQNTCTEYAYANEISVSCSFRTCGEGCNGSDECEAGTQCKGGLCVLDECALNPSLECTCTLPPPAAVLSGS